MNIFEDPNSDLSREDWIAKLLGKPIPSKEAELSEVGMVPGGGTKKRKNKKKKKKKKQVRTRPVTKYQSFEFTNSFRKS